MLSQQNSVSIRNRKKRTRLTVCSQFVLNAPEEESVQDEDIPAAAASNTIIVSPNCSSTAVPAAQWVSPSGTPSAADKLVSLLLYL